MSNKPNTKKRARPRPSPVAVQPATAPWWQSPIVWVVGLVVIALAITIALSVGGDDAVEKNEIGQAEVIGEALPRFSQPDTAIGMTVPTISAQDFDGDRIQVRSNGNARVYGFFAHWCPHCQAELPRISAWLEENELPDGVEMVAVSTNVDPIGGNYPPSAWFEREGWPDAVVVDSASNAVATGFGLAGFPYWVAANADGEVVLRASGELTTEQFETLLAAVTPEAS